ncbi:hypothetical protein [Spirochaeta isovalerica]|uniref:Lipoprotein n=1 Tax=Spirochaeta isovalerica TaxID=150 RepID=A0A841R7N2_9SPIO|nr:hypothetical protein [Spirochaeta isovalerica]MBB6479836.1 hypothetical protein [Spirochaeta isovalerica]
MRSSLCLTLITGLLLLSGCDFLSSLSSDSDSEPAEPDSANSAPLITVDFDYQESQYTSYTNIYVIWLENSSGDIQHLYVCERLLPDDGTRTSDYKTITDRLSALPFWHLNRYDENDADLMNDAVFQDDVDAVTGATQRNSDFTVSRAIAERMGNEFTLYLEVDESFEYNEWFPGTKFDMTDQPAVLYSADIDLSSDKTDYTLTPIGFTPMYSYETYYNTSFASYNNNSEVTSFFELTADDETARTNGTLSFEKGILFEDMRYITHSRTETASSDYIFGTAAPSESSIRSISGITAAISR